MPLSVRWIGKRMSPWAADLRAKVWLCMISSPKDQTTSTFRPSLSVQDLLGPVVRASFSYSSFHCCYNLLVNENKKKTCLLFLFRTPSIASMPILFIHSAQIFFPPNQWPLASLSFPALIHASYLLAMSLPYIMQLWHSSHTLCLSSVERHSFESQDGRQLLI